MLWMLIVATAVAVMVAITRSRSSCEQWPDYPRAIPAGLETMSAAGGGGGSIRLLASTDPPDLVAAWFRQHLGPPTSQSDTSVSWKRRQGAIGWRGRSSLTVRDVTAGRPPALDTPVPPGTRCYIVYDHLDTPRLR